MPAVQDDKAYKRINQADQDQPEYSGDIGFFFLFPVFLVIRVIIRIIGFPVPHIRDCVIGNAVHLLQGKPGKGCASRTHTAVTAEAGKYGYIVLFRSCFAVIFDILPFPVCIIYLLTESVDTFNAQVGTVPSGYFIRADITAEQIQGIRFNRNRLGKTGVIFIDVADSNGIPAFLAVFACAEHAVPDLGIIGVCIPVLGDPVFINFCKISIDEQVFRCSAAGGKQHNDQHRQNHEQGKPFICHQSVTHLSLSVKHAARLERVWDIQEFIIPNFDHIEADGVVQHFMLHQVKRGSPGDPLLFSAVHGLQPASGSA